MTSCFERISGHCNFLVVCCVTARELIILNILQELWYGNVRPNEDKILTDEEKELVSLIARHHETLSSSLKDNDLDVFEKYIDCFTEYASLIEAQAFEIGFKLAIKLLIDRE